MSRVRTQALIVAALCAASLIANVDDDWRELYAAAAKAAALKDYVRAEATYAKALQKAEIFGKDDPRVAATLQGRAVLYRTEKKLPEAEDDASRAVSIYGNNPGPTSPEYAGAELALAGILMEVGKYQPALEAVQKALPLVEQNQGSNGRILTDATCMFGDALRQMKRFASAEKPLKRCADLRMEDGGVATPEFGEAANSLAIVYQHTGNYKDADSYFTYAARIREQALGLQSQALAETLEAHAALLRQLGRGDEAKKKEKLAAVIRRSAKK